MVRMGLVDEAMADQQESILLQCSTTLLKGAYLSIADSFYVSRWIVMPVKQLLNRGNLYITNFIQVPICPLWMDSVLYRLS